MNERSRNWTFIVYPESAPGNWIEILNGEFISFAVSPLHCDDVNPDGEIKKEHYHVLLCFEGNKSYKQILEITNLVNGTIPQIVKNCRAMIRYFCHLDNPDKAQYPLSDILSFGGLDVYSYVLPTKADVNFYIGQMQNFIKQNNIYELCDLADYCLENKIDSWYPVLLTHTIFLNKYITSYRHAPKNRFSEGVSFEGGESND